MQHRSESFRDFVYLEVRREHRSCTAGIVGIDALTMTAEAGSNHRPMDRQLSGQPTSV